MRRSPAVLVVAALLAVGAAVVLSTTGSAQAPELRTLTFTEQGAREFESKFDPKKFSPDDTYVFTARLVANGRSVGSDQGACTAVASNAVECRATLYLKEGKIFVSGGTRFGAKTTLGVVGGTGAYIGVRGTMTVIARSSGDFIEIKLLP